MLTLFCVKHGNKKHNFWDFFVVLDEQIIENENGNFKIKKDSSIALFYKYGPHANCAKKNKVMYQTDKKLPLKANKNLHVQGTTFHTLLHFGDFGVTLFHFSGLLELYVPFWKIQINFCGKHKVPTTEKCITS